MWSNDANSADAIMASLAHDFVRQVAPPETPLTSPLPGSQSQDQSLPADKPVISTPDELKAYVWNTFGVRIPEVRVCARHQSPWDFFRDVYFSTSERSVFVLKGSRGLAGKSYLMALLGTVIATTLRGDVTILGGSSQQSDRVHGAMAKFWAAPNAPRELVEQTTTTKTTFKGAHTIEALTASQRSVRGPHPLLLILDEVDEMEWKIFEASMGQTMDQHGYPGRTALGSTHQYADKTMSKILAMAAEKGWPVYEWCWRETCEPHGWLTVQQVERKRREMTEEMWRVEVELGEPSIEGRAIATEKVERMFMGAEITALGAPEFPYAEFEPPVQGAHYVTGGDWGRTKDFVEIATLRDDVWPMRLVAYQRFRKRPAPYIIAQWEYQTSRYPGESAHDSTSLGGKIMHDLISPEGQDTGVEGVTMVGRVRANLFTDYILGVEHEEVVSPRIVLLYNQHKFVTNDDLRPGGTGHPPDGFVACAMAYKASRASTRPLTLLTGHVAPPRGYAALVAKTEPPALPPAKGLARALAFLEPAEPTVVIARPDDIDVP